MEDVEALGRARAEHRRVLLVEALHFGGRQGRAHAATGSHAPAPALARERNLLVVDEGARKREVSTHPSWDRGHVATPIGRRPLWIEAEHELFGPPRDGIESRQ